MQRDSITPLRRNSTTPCGVIQPPPGGVIQPPTRRNNSKSQNCSTTYRSNAGSHNGGCSIRSTCMCERALARTVKNRSKGRQVTTHRVSSLRPVPTRRQPLANRPPVSCTWPKTFVLNEWRNQLGSSFRTVRSGPGLQPRPTHVPWRAEPFFISGFINAACINAACMVPDGVRRTG
jgi:hypothetical protein